MALYKKQADKKSGDGLALTEWNDLSSAVAGDAGLTLAINPTDKIGIGTSNPTAKLDIVGDIKANGNVSLEPGNSVSVNYGPWGIGNRKFIEFQTNYLGDGYRGQVHLYAPSNYYTNVPALTLAGNYGPGGNVGIGITSPAEKLEVDGNVKAAKFIGDGSQLTNLSLGETGVNLATAADSKVGIGTADPQEKLDVNGKLRLSASFSSLHFSANKTKQFITFGSWSTHGYGIGVQSHTQYFRSNADFAWFRGGSHTDARLNPGSGGAALMVLTDGKLGIGTDGPIAKLHLISAPTDANGQTLTLGPSSGLNSNLRLGYHKDYSWIQSHGAKPLRINPLGNEVQIGAPLRLTDSGNQCRMAVHRDRLVFQLVKSVHGSNKGISWDGDTNWDSFSDQRLKTNIVKEKDILPRLMQLDVKNYHWKDEPDREQKLIGFMAQDVQPLFPALVGEMEDEATKETRLTLKYASFGVLAVGALKELKQEYDARIAALEAALGGLTNP
jgi:hypothetical protein